MEEVCIVPVTIFKDYLIVTVTILKVLLSAAPKVPEFCPEVEGNPVHLGEPVVCKLVTLVNELSLLGWEFM